MTVFYLRLATMARAATDRWGVWPNTLLLFVVNSLTGFALLLAEHHVTLAVCLWGFAIVVGQSLSLLFAISYGQHTMLKFVTKLLS